MTAPGSRRIAAIAIVAALALVAWRLWPDGGGPDATAQARAAATASDRGPAPAMPGPSPSRSRAAAPLSDATQGAFERIAAADDDAACAKASRGRLQAIRSALDPARSAEDAFAHAVLGELLALGASGPGAPDALQRAAQDATAWQRLARRWPGDLDIAWRAATTCSPRLGCDEDAALRHLLAAESDNAAAWLLAMRAAWNRGDPVAYDAALARAAASPRYAPRTGSVFLRLQPLLAAAPLPSTCIRADGAAALSASLGRAATAEDWAGVEALSMEFAFGNAFDYGSLSGCAPSGTDMPARRRGDCIAVLSWLADGDTLVERHIALPLLVRLGGDTPQGRTWRERYRQLLYLRQQVPPRGLLPGEPARLLAIGEVEALRQQAIAQGAWPPPADWLPADPRQRMLVTHGRLPPGVR